MWSWRRRHLPRRCGMTAVCDDPLGDRFGLISRFGLDPAKGRNRRNPTTSMDRGEGRLSTRCCHSLGGTKRRLAVGRSGSEVADSGRSLTRISSALTPSTPGSAARASVPPHPARSGFHYALRYLIPRCETFQGFCGSWGIWSCGAEPICRRWSGTSAVPEPFPASERLHVITERYGRRIERAVGEDSSQTRFWSHWNITGLPAA